MHCLNPREIINPHYSKRREKGRAALAAWRLAHHPDLYPDDYKILIPCGKCLGCLRDLARSWRVRLLHEYLYGSHRSALFITLTIDELNYEKFQKSNFVTTAFRSFIDRLRYYVKGRKSPKRFFVSELGETTGRLHFHGIIFDHPEIDTFVLRRCWPYGFISCKPVCSARQLTYITKYITKPVAEFHRPYVFASPGLGAGYLLQSNWMDWHHAGDSEFPINMFCRFDHFVYSLPRYYRDKIFSPVEIAGFKDVLSGSDRPFEKVLGRITYTDRLQFAKDRERLYATTLRQGKSRLPARPLADSFSQTNPYLDPPNEFLL